MLTFAQNLKMQFRTLTHFSDIPQKAFKYWAGSLVFQLLFSMIYFTIYLSLTFFVFNYFGIMGQINELSTYVNGDTEVLKEKYIEILSSDNFKMASLCTIIISAIVWPLNLGLLRIYQKMDQRESVSTSDLFIAYEGSNFFKFLSYSLFWSAFYFLAKSFIILAPIWVLITLFVGPLMLFKNLDFKTAFQLGLQAISKNIPAALLVLIVGVMGSYCGIFLFGFGLFLTFPFWNALIYTFYKEVFIN